MLKNIAVRVATIDDQAFLFEMLYQSIFHGPGTPKPERSIINAPEIAKYVENWGKPGDFALIATNSKGQRVGAVWLRYFNASNKGYGYVSDQIPEIGIAVDECVRGRGIGTALLKELLMRIDKSVPALSLSVQPENPAMRLYQKLGFYDCGKSGDSIVMRFDNGKYVGVSPETITQ